MPLPANVTQTTVTGTFLWIDGAPAAGSVTFLPAIEYVLDADSNATIYMYEVSHELDINGQFSAPLIPTDDPDLNPTGWTYTVRVLLNDPTALPGQSKPVETIFAIEVPVGPSIDLADMMPVQSSPGNAVVKGPPGDPGPIASINGDAGPDVVLDAADVEADPVGSAAAVQASLNQHVVQTPDAHDASAVSFAPTGPVTATNVQAAIAEDAGHLTAHVNSTGIVHTAAAVSFVPGGTIASSTVQTAIAEDSAELAAHIAAAVDSHDASAISFVPGGTIAATNVQAALSEAANEAASGLSAHLVDTIDAHDASAISVVPGGTIAANNVQSALTEVAADAATGTAAVNTSLSAHLTDPLDSHPATSITFTPGSGIAAINVQAAIIEDVGDLAAHKVQAAAAHAASAVSFVPAVGIAATTVQAAIVEDAGDLAAHIAKASAVHLASAIAYTPGGSIAATNVQTAIAEAAAEAVNSTNSVAVNLAAHLADPLDSHDASSISFIPTGTIASVDVQGAITEAINESLGSGQLISNHVNNPTDAHDASAVSFLPTGTIAALNVQAAIAEASGDTTGLTTSFNAHINNITDAHDASAVSFVPTGTIAAVNVQAAIAEASGDTTALTTSLNAHKAQAAAAHAASAISFVPIGTIAATTVQAAIFEVADDAGVARAAVDTRVTDHLADPLAAHAASAISIADVGGLITAVDVEGALAEHQTAFNAHIVSTTAAHGGIVPSARTITTTAPLTGGGALSGNLTLAATLGTELVPGVIELATVGETTPGTDVTRAVHAAGVKAALDARNITPTTRLINSTAPLSGGGSLAGDLTLTLLDNGVTNAKLADMATNTIKGRAVAAGTGDPTDLTSAQATAILDNFTTALKGLVPPPVAVAGKYLKDDGTWAAVLDQAAGDTRYVNTTGDTMSGALRIPQQAGVGGQIIGTDGADVEQGSIRISTTETNLKHLTQVSVLTAAAQRLIITTTGISALLPVTLQADPTIPLGAATKQYVDTKAFVPTTTTIATTAPLTGGGALSGNLTLAAAAASTTATGVVELATPAEATASVDAVRAVTPAGLIDRVLTTRTITTTAPLSGGGDLSANRTISITSATEALTGAVELATQVETDLGVDDSRAVTPLKLAMTLPTRAAPKTFTINPQTLSYTLVLTDATKVVTVNNAGATTVTVPNETAVNFPIGSFVELLRYGAGTVAVAGQSPAVIRATPGAGLRAQYSRARLIKIGVEEWSLSGDLV